MDCPKCKSNRRIKFGIVGGRQRFHCKDCKLSYTVSEVGKPEVLKKFALQLYLEGNGFRQIGRLLKISHVSAYNWVRKYGEQASQVDEISAPAPIIEMDELFTFSLVKKTNIGSGRQLIGSGKGSSASRLEHAELARAINSIRK